MRARLAAVITLTAFACGGEQGRESARSESPTIAKKAAVKPDALWSYAPEDWVVAILVRDGTLAEIDTAADEMRRIVSGVGSEQLLDQLRELAALPPPVDPLDPSSLARVGIDVSRGGALFIGPDLSVTAVLSVSDRDKLRASWEGTKSGSGDLYDVAYCEAARGRYLCASDRGRWSKVAKQTGGTALKSDFVLEAKTPAGARDITEILGNQWAPVGARALSMTADLQNGRAIARIIIDTSPPPGWLQARRRPAPRALTETDKTAAGFLRLRLPAADLRRLPWPRVGPVDASELLAPELTGDLSLIASGQDPLGAHAVLGLRNGSPVKLALRAACRLARFGGFGSFGWGNNRCRGNLKLKKLGLPRHLLQWLPPRVRTAVLINKSSAIISMIASPMPGSAIFNASGPVAQNLHSTDWNIATWGRWTDPELVLTGAQAQAFRAHLHALNAPREVAAIRALLAHVYDAGGGVRATDKGLIVEGSITTFANDSKDVFDSYSIAAIELGRGNLPGYLQGVANIARSKPRTLAAQQAKSRGLPIVPLAGLGMFLEHIGIQ